MEALDSPDPSRPGDGPEANVKSALGASSSGQDGEVIDSSSNTSSLPVPDLASQPDNRPEFGLREDSTDDATNFDVVLIHGIRDSCKTVWVHENESNWVKSDLLGELDVNILEFRYDISDTAPIYSEGMDIEAVRLLEDLVKIHESRPLRPLIFVTRDLGGIIAQMSWLIASSKPFRYGIVVQLTNLMVFYNCPHRNRNMLDAHDTMIQLLNLSSFPEAPDLTAVSTKARRLAEQVDMANYGAVDAKLWQYIPTISIVSLPLRKKSEDSTSTQDSDGSPGSQTYDLGGDSRILQQPLEHAIGISKTHIELAQYTNDTTEMRLRGIKDYFLKNAEQDSTGNHNTGTFTWRCLVSECPPVRLPLAQNIHAGPSDDQFWTWFRDQEEYQFWYDRADLGTHILHVHGSSMVDVWSDKIYHGVNQSGHGTTVHFKFDRNDARFDNVHGMMSYLVTRLLRWHCFQGELSIVNDFMPFLSNSRACSTADLFQWLLILRQYEVFNKVRYIISCIDQCRDDILGYLHQILEIGKHTELRFKILVTSNANSECMKQLEDCSSIDLDRFVAHGQYSPNGFDLQNRRLFGELSALDYETKILVNETLASSELDLQLSGMLLTWLTSVQRSHGLGPEAIEMLKNITRPASAVSISAAIRATLPGNLKALEEEVLVIVKNAFHPLSIDQIAWALASNNNGGSIRGPQQKTAGLRGQNTADSPRKSGDFDAASDMASRHAMMARICLGYLSIPEVQTDIENFHKAEFDDGVYPAYFGNNLTTYSVKFLSLHYQLAGEKRPKQEFFNFHDDKKSRMTWYNVNFRLTSHLRRPLYIDSLPVLSVIAQTGLVDLTAMFIGSERHKENFEVDANTALIEAARYGRKEVVNLLLDEIDVRVGALKDAISSAASYGDVEPLYALVSRCAIIEDFEWPEDILHRTSWLGLSAVVDKLLEAGVTPNPTKEPQNFEGDSPLTLCMPGRHHQTAELLIQKGRADVNAKTSTERFALAQAARYSNPKTVALLLQCHAGDDNKDIQIALDDACFSGAFTSVQELLKKSPPIDWESAAEQHTVSLADPATDGYLQCVEVLSNHGANANLKNGEMLPLLAAVDNELIPMVKLLVERGADLELQDARETLRTALSIASTRPNKELLDYLLSVGADVNHIAVGSHSPLLAAAWYGRADNVKTLLNHGADINAVVPTTPNWAPINAAYDNPATLKALIEGGADINHRSRDGTVLFEASSWGFEATVELLLEYRNKLDVDKELVDEDDGENNGMTPLCIACKYHRVGIMRLLLEAGANAQHKTRHGRFPLELCTEYVPNKLPDQALRLLLEYYPRIDLHQRDNKGNTALHKIKVWTPLSMVKLLVNAGADLNAVNHKGYTPLMVALQAANVEICRYLFGKTANLPGISGTGSCLLHRAAFGANLDLIKMVFEAGADVNEIDPRTGETPLYTHLTGPFTSMPVVQYLVETGKADVNLTGVGSKYPIMQAYKKSPEIIRFLVEAGANVNVNVKDHAGRSPIHALYYNTGYTDLAFLVDHGADLGARDKLGRTAVHYAAALADENDVEKLLTLSNIDVNQADDDGWTPLMWASLQRRTWNLDYVAKVLIDRGADIWVRGKVEDEEWSPLKLAKFHGGYGSWVLEQLEPVDKSKPRDLTGGIARNVLRCMLEMDILHPGHENFEGLGERFGPEDDTEPREDDGSGDDVSEDEVLSEESQVE
ncbi:hypothetical protein CIB48_g4930 [Xylaria polymorpha]|nr:hypothetical protein CIB48_g4930 [Xylaria polymorpha]